jgi:signal transduction histidine kinase
VLARTAANAAWEALRAVIEDISGELQLRPLLTRIVIHACNLIGADNGTIGLYDPAKDAVRTEAVYRMPPGELGAEMPRGVGLAGEVLRTGEPLLLQRYGDAPTPTQPGLVENAVLGVPILWRGAVIGIFGIGGSPGGKNRFEVEDADLLTLFARHAAVAIVNAQRYEREQESRRDTQLLFDTSARMSVAASMDDVVTAYLEQVAAGGKFACTVTEYEWDGQRSGDPLRVRILGYWTPGDGLHLTDRWHPYVRDTLDDLLDAGETVAISDVHADPRVNPTLREIQRESGRPALALIPLRGQGPHRLGHVILSAPDIHPWAADDLKRYQITATQLAAALDSRRQQELVARRQQELVALEERRRLARDLHDAVTQMLFSLNLIAQSVPPVLKRDPVEAARRMDRVVELSHSALTEMRALLAELRPADDRQEDAPDATRALTTRLRRDGLAATLSAYVAQVNDAQASLSGPRPRVFLERAGYRPVLSAEQEEALFRVAQEAVGNAAKHGGAARINVRLVTLDTETLLLVRDDGQGFDPSAPKSQSAGSGLGLSTMRERAEAVGGTLTLFSAPGQGTEVTLTVARDAWGGTVAREATPRE